MDDADEKEAHIIALWLAVKDLAEGLDSAKQEIEAIKQGRRDDRTETDDATD